MTVDAVTQVMDKVKGDKLREICSSDAGLNMPEPLVDEIFQRRYSTDSEKSRAIASAYVNIHRDPSWEHLTMRLYLEEEFPVARESKSFTSTGKYCSALSSFPHSLHIYWLELLAVI